MVKISVVMGVYNTKKEWLEEAIESILQQTLSDFEFIIVLDCPTDGSVDVVKNYAKRDERIVVIENDKNIGLTCSLNRGIAAAKGKYIARMDADDIAVPDRFEKQFAYMESHPDVAVVGGRVYSNNVFQYEWTNDSELFRIRMLFRNVGVPHPTAMIRKALLDKYNITYTEEIKKSQDYKLWIDIMDYGKVMMMPDIVLMYRIHDAQISSGRNSQMDYAHKVSREQAVKLLQKVTDDEMELHYTVTEPELPGNNVKNLNNYMDRIIAANNKMHIYDPLKLKNELDYMWCRKAIRRAVCLKKIDMLLSLRMFRIFRLSVLKSFIENSCNKKSYMNAVKSAEVK